MSVIALSHLINRLPHGRARARYEHRLKAAGEEALAITAPYSDQPLWVVAGQPQVQRLMGQGIARWRIWTLAEVQDLLEACGSPTSSLEEAAHLLASECPPEGTAEGMRRGVIR